MSTADRFRRLAALGLSTEQIAGVLEIMDAESETRRANGRERWHKWKDKQLANVSKHEQTLAVHSREPARVEDNLLRKELSGKEVRKEEKTRVARSPFPEFWAIYPHRVGRREAESAFVKALTRADLATILDGVRRYAAKTDDRPWCNPATFLNQDRWTDNPAPQPMRAATGPPAKPRNAGELALMRLNGTYPHEPPDKIFGRLDSGDGRRQVEDLGDVLRPAFGTKHVS